MNCLPFISTRSKQKHCKMDADVLVLTHISESYAWKFVQQCVRELQVRWGESAGGRGGTGVGGANGDSELDDPELDFPFVVPFGR